MQNCLIYYILDIDECSSSSGMCEFGKCVNIDGSYKCICDEGYKSSDNGKRCVGRNTFISRHTPSQFIPELNNVVVIDDIIFITIPSCWC